MPGIPPAQCCTAAGAAGKRPEHLPSLSPLVPECRFEVLAAVEDAFDQHDIGRDDKGDGDTALESDCS
jgi:hypothetical protein